MISWLPMDSGQDDKRVRLSGVEAFYKDVSKHHLSTPLKVTKLSSPLFAFTNIENQGGVN